METTQQKLDHLVSLGEQLNDWDRGFVESVADQYKQRNLSYGQIEVVNKILAKHSPEQIKARNAWRASYDEEKQALMRLAAEYYTANGPYFRDVAHKVLNDSAYIPTEKCFNKMTQNKYVQRWIAQREAGPAFVKGQLVRFRRNALVRHWYGSQLQGTLAVVLGVGTDDQVSATKGSRPYEVLPVGRAKPFSTEERCLVRSKTA